jgi:hypothetical protein
MTTVHYQIIQHDGGWAYKVDGTISETFATHDKARAAAARAASEQTVPGDSSVIAYEDEAGRMHEETVSSVDRPATDVKG